MCPVASRALDKETSGHRQVSSPHPLVVPETTDRGLVWIALAIALGIHLIALVVRLPARDSVVAHTPHREQAVTLKRYIPPPPPIERRQVAVRKSERRLPIPDPTPDDLEPVIEPPLQSETLVTTPDVDLLIGTPEPPPRSNTLVAGVGDVTHPLRIEDSYVAPEYPEQARVGGWPVRC